MNKNSGRLQFIGPNNNNFEILLANHGAALTIIKVPTTINENKSNSEGIIFIKSGILNLNVSYSKSTPFHTFEATILPSSYNLLSEILPGDYCLVHIVNDRSIIDNIEQDIVNLRPVNLEQYGFKGVFKIESIRQNYQINPNTGAKILTYQLTGYAFKELNSVIYYNPFLIFENEKTDVLVGMSRLAKEFAKFLSQKKLDAHKNDYVIQFLWSAFLGRGGIYKTDKKLPDTPNTVFTVPATLLNLMGVKINRSGQLKHLYKLLTGVQKYSSYEPKIQSPNLAVTVFLPQFWDQVPIWNILKGFENAPVDELFALFRKDNTGKIMPWVFYRQIPYNSKKLKLKYPVTYFHELPVWAVHDSFILGYNIGRDDSQHINYVSVFSTSPAAHPNVNAMHLNFQVAAKNVRQDKLDIQRHGLRSAIITTRHDDLMVNKKDIYAVTFTQILADAMMYGHLKLNGVVHLSGIQAAITIGDNFLLYDTLFHIEAIKHTFAVDPATGKTHFVTTLGLSYGVKADPEALVQYTKLRNMTLEDEKQINPSLPTIAFNPIDINK